MTTTDWIVNLSILALMVLTALGTRPITFMTYLRPLLIVVGVGLVFLRGMPVSGPDVGLELAGVGAGVVFGVLAAGVSRVSWQGGRVMLSSGAAYAAVWLAAIALRVAFAELATHNADFGRGVAQFSMQHQITGADAWRAAFVLMALAMIVTRVGLVALRAGMVQDAARADLAAPQPEGVQ